MTNTPIYDAVLASTHPEMRPTFERVISHADFLRQHHWADWLYDLLARTES